jgi:hypothetical protein
MSNPNILSATSILGKMGMMISNTTPANVVSNAAGSNTLVKISTLTLANFSTTSITANAEIFRSGTSYYILSNISLPNNTSIAVSGKDTAFYLEEGDGLRIVSSANLSITAAYEIIS